MIKSDRRGRTCLFFPRRRRFFRRPLDRGGVGGRTAADPRHLHWRRGPAGQCTLEFPLHAIPGSGVRERIPAGSGGGLRGEAIALVEPRRERPRPLGSARLRGEPRWRALGRRLSRRRGVRVPRRAARPGLWGHRQSGLGAWVRLSLRAPLREGRSCDGEEWHSRPAHRPGGNGLAAPRLAPWHKRHPRLAAIVRHAGRPGGRDTWGLNTGHLSLNNVDA